jgi:alanine racemase
VLDVRNLPKGAPVGYGGQYRTPRPMRVGVLAVGYADGVPHSLGNRAEARFIAGGQWAQVLGAVSMDLTSIDLSNAPHLKPGDSVTLIGREGELMQDAQMLARAARTISYSLLCGIHARVRRVYV